MLFRSTPAQRKIYTLVYESQKDAMKAVKPGAKFRDFHIAASEVLAKGLEEMGVLPIPAQESLKADVGLHRRWTVHGTGHMLGMDVHDCAKARKEAHTEGVLRHGREWPKRHAEPGARQQHKAHRPEAHRQRTTRPR